MEQQKPPQNKGIKILKFIGTSVVMFFVLVFIVVVLVFYYLPSAQDVKRHFQKEKTNLTQTPVKKNAVDVVISQDKNQLAEHNTSESAENSPTYDHKNQSSQELQKFMDEQTPISEFCGKLNQARSGPLKALNILTKSKEKTTQLLESDFEEMDDEEAFSDLRLEAIMPLAKVVIKKPEMKKLVTMIMQSESLDENQKKELESEGVLDKAHFYAQAYSAYNELKTNIDEYEAVVDRTYLLYKLNDLIALKPDLQNDQRVQKFCEDSEYLFNSYAPVNFNNEKATFERLISELGVDQNQIKYDPNYKTKLDVKFSGNSLQMGGGWLNELVPASMQK